MVLVILLLILSLAFHEAAHAFVAYLRGDSTAKRLGRMTLNPLPHIDPVMTIALPAILMMTTGFIFGGAKPVPVVARNLHHPLRDMVWVALAGPVSNFILAILFALIWKFTVMGGLLGNENEVYYVLVAAVYFNVLLAVFNLLPIPPLDGSRVLAYLLPNSLRGTYDALERYGLLIIFGLIYLGALNGILVDGMRYGLDAVDAVAGTAIRPGIFR